MNCEENNDNKMLKKHIIKTSSKYKFPPSQPKFIIKSFENMVNRPIIV